MSPPITQFRWHIQEFGQIALPDSAPSALLSKTFTPMGTDFELQLIFCYNTPFGKYSSMIQAAVTREGEAVPKLLIRFWAETTSGKNVVEPMEVEEKRVNSGLAFTLQKFFNHYKTDLRAVLSTEVDDTLIIVCEVQPLVQETQKVVTIDDGDVIQGILCKINDSPHFVKLEPLFSRFDEFQHAIVKGRDKRDVIQIFIQGLKEEAAEAFIHYIYEGQLNDEQLRTSVDYLYYIAYNYKMPTLKEICTDYMLRSFSDEKVFMWLGFGLDCDDEILTDYAFSYLQENHNGETLDSLIEMDQWQRLKRTFPKVFEKMNETLSEVLKMD